MKSKMARWARLKETTSRMLEHWKTSSQEAKPFTMILRKRGLHFRVRQIHIASAVTLLPAQGPGKWKVLMQANRTNSMRTPGSPLFSSRRERVTVYKHATYLTPIDLGTTGSRNCRNVEYTINLKLTYGIYFLARTYLPNSKNSFLRLPLRCFFQTNHSNTATETCRDIIGKGQPSVDRAPMSSRSAANIFAEV